MRPIPGSLAIVLCIAASSLFWGCRVRRPAGSASVTEPAPSASISSPGAVALREAEERGCAERVELAVRALAATNLDSASYGRLTLMPPTRRGVSPSASRPSGALIIYEVAASVGDATLIHEVGVSTDCRIELVRQIYAD